jgi:hypothetical protein
MYKIREFWHFLGLVFAMRQHWPSPASLIDVQTVHQCSHEHCRQQRGPGYARRNKGVAACGTLQILLSGGRRENYVYSHEMLNQHVTCAIARRTCVNSDWPLNLEWNREIVQLDTFELPSGPSLICSYWCSQWCRLWISPHPQYMHTALALPLQY